MEWITILLIAALAFLYWREKSKEKREKAERQENAGEVPGWREALDAEYERRERPQTAAEKLEEEFEQRREAGPEGGWTTPPNTDERWREMDRWLDKLDREEERRTEALERKEEREEERQAAKLEKQEEEQYQREEWGKHLASLLGHEPTDQEEKRCRKSFGGWSACLDNMELFTANAGIVPKVLIVPPTNYYRKNFETLAKNGVILGGDAAKPIDRLDCLGMDQLRVLADACGAKRAQSKDELRRRIAAQGAEAIAAAWPALGIPESDIFLLDPDRIRGLCG